jgi:hypothetical protein
MALTMKAPKLIDIRQKRVKVAEIPGFSTLNYFTIFRASW